MGATTLSIGESVAALKQGGVIAYPTEAVWGLGCDPFNEAAVMRLLAIKQRDVVKGLILVAGDRTQLDGLLDWSAMPAGPDRTPGSCRPPCASRAGSSEHIRALPCASAPTRPWRPCARSLAVRWFPPAPTGQANRQLSIAPNSFAACSRNSTVPAKARPAD